MINSLFIKMHSRYSRDTVGQKFKELIYFPIFFFFPGQWSENKKEFMLSGTTLCYRK